MMDLRRLLEESLGSAYSIERELGGGGMSRTFVATETALARRVVIKVLAPELLAGISVERFKREVLLAAKLQHPHIVPVLATGDAEGLPWFTMPYVDGESLRHRLGSGPLGIAEIIGILRDVERALEFAHSRGVVHRDIKPDNVLLAGSSATVTDFGIAKAINAARTSGDGATLTVAGTTLGTPAYMPPEQAAGDPNLDQRSDIYSFGAMAYEMLAGRAPFVATSPAKIVAAHFSDIPRPITAVRSDTPTTLAALVMQCLEKDPASRPQHAAALVRVLETVTSSGTAQTAASALIGGHIRLGRALAAWAAVTALVALVAWAATAVIGLPDWVLPGALGVMLAGLPVIGFTWYAQHAAQRAHATMPTYTPASSRSEQGVFASVVAKASPHVSWRRTWISGAVAVATFAVLVIAFMVTRALGIGPAGSLLAAGKLEQGQTLVVADMRGPPGDSTLGVTVAEALRTDLRQSGTLNVMTRASMGEILGLMQRKRDTTVDSKLAREIATREGARAVLDGEIIHIGQTYVVSARLVSGVDGSELANFSATADDENDLVRSLGKLSRDIRGKIGESLKNIREAKPLERVTTSSLAALRKYVEAVRQSDELGNQDRGLALLEEAVALDTAFAMAWRKMSVILFNIGSAKPREMDAVSRAFRHRERLSDGERLLTEAFYYSNGPEPNRARALAAYETLLEADPKNGTALNNAGVNYEAMRDWEKAADRYRRALDVPRPFGHVFINLMLMQLRLGQTASLEPTQTWYRARVPTHGALWAAEWIVRWSRGDIHGADSVARATFETTTVPREKSRSARFLAGSAYLRGRLREGLRWNVESKLATRASGAAPHMLVASFDSAFHLAFFLQDVARARTTIRNGLARTPMTEIHPASRPWNEMGLAAVSMRDPALAREAQNGFERDLPLIGSQSSEGDRARMRGWSALASGQYAEAIAAFRIADREFAIGERRALLVFADAFDLSGQVDSAVAYYEQFIRTPDVLPGENGMYVAGAHKRLAELYDARADTGRAEAHYQLFLDLWQDADEELEPKIREVNARLSAKRRQRG